MKIINKLLGQTVGKNLKVVNVFYCDTFLLSPCVSEVLRTYANLLEKDLAPNFFYWKKLDKLKVVWCEDQNNLIISILVFEIESETKTSKILTTATNPNFLNFGYSKICYNYYLKEISKLGIKRSIGYVAINNDKVILNAQNARSYIGGLDHYSIIFAAKF